LLRTSLICRMMLKQQPDPWLLAFSIPPFGVLNQSAMQFSHLSSAHLLQKPVGKGSALFVNVARLLSVLPG